MAHDIDRLRQQGSKAQRLNLPALRAAYKRVLAELAEPEGPDCLLDYLAAAVQAAAKAARSMSGGATAPDGAARASLPPPPPRSQPAAAAAAEEEAAEESDQSAPEEQQAQEVMSAEEARERAQQLAAAHPLAEGLAGGVAHVQLQLGSGPAWSMAWLACPTSASVSQLAEVRGRRRASWGSLHSWLSAMPGLLPLRLPWFPAALLPSSLPTP